MKKVQGKLTLCRVVRHASDAKEVERSQEALQSAANRIASFNGYPTETNIVKHENVEAGIIQAAEGYDAVMVGAAGKSIYPQILFGSIPESLARDTNKTVIVVKNHNPVKALLGRVVGE